MNRNGRLEKALDTLSKRKDTMSEDLIERLNNGATSLPMACRDMELAAAEIERLRAKLVEVKRLTDGLNDEVQFMRNVAKENRNRTEAAEKRLAYANRMLAQVPGALNSFFSAAARKTDGRW